jgi:hypothetical protein
VNRRTYLAATGGAVATLAGGTAVASATRADILADSEMTRGDGAPVEIAHAPASESAKYRADGDTVAVDGTTVPFERWARREAFEAGADAVVPTIGDRLDRSLEGVGSGVRHLVFGLVVAVDHTVTRNRDGDVTSEPNVSLDRLSSVAPRTMTVTVSLDGRESTTDVPVGVGHVEMHQL